MGHYQQDLVLAEGVEQLGSEALFGVRSWPSMLKRGTWPTDLRTINCGFDFDRGKYSHDDFIL